MSLRDNILQYGRKSGVIETGKMSPRGYFVTIQVNRGGRFVPSTAEAYGHNVPGHSEWSLNVT
jgi:hypothetical protein